MKKFILGLTIVQGIFVAFGLFMYLSISELPVLERQTFVILINLKFVILVALYVAWRVTPNSKQ